VLKPETSEGTQGLPEKPVPVRLHAGETPALPGGAMTTAHAGETPAPLEMPWVRASPARWRVRRPGYARLRRAPGRQRRSGDPPCPSQRPRRPTFISVACDCGHILRGMIRRLAPRCEAPDHQRQQRVDWRRIHCSEHPASHHPPRRCSLESRLRERSRSANSSVSASSICGMISDSRR